MYEISKEGEGLIVKCNGNKLVDVSDVAILKDNKDIDGYKVLLTIRPKDFKLCLD